MNDGRHTDVTAARAVAATDEASDIPALPAVGTNAAIIAKGNSTAATVAAMESSTKTNVALKVTAAMVPAAATGATAPAARVVVLLA